MKIRAKIPSGALQLVVFISAAVAVLLAAFLVLTHTHIFFKKQSYVLVTTVKNADFGIQYALVAHTALHDTVSIPIAGKSKDTVSINRTYWGIFEKITAVSTTNHKKIIKMALSGGQYPLGKRPALYLKDQSKPLLLAGNTKIEGISFLPEKAVQPGTISGSSYSKDQLIYGKIRKSTSSLPELPITLIAHLDTVTRQGFLGQDDEIAYEINKPHNNSFSDPVKYLYSPASVYLEDAILTGNIVVYAKKKIIVAASSHLSDVILIAPEIEIKEGVQGNFQALASDRIYIGKNSKLYYPSVLAVKEYQHHKKEDSKVSPKILVAQNTVIKGIVLFMGKERQRNYTAQVSLEKGTTIYGEVYCNQNLALKGSVYGSVYTSNFVVSQSGNQYQNHLFNTTISSRHLPEAYTGLPWKTTAKKVVKWLY